MRFFIAPWLCTILLAFLYPGHCHSQETGLEWKHTKCFLKAQATFVSRLIREFGVNGDSEEKKAIRKHETSEIVNVYNRKVLNTINTIRINQAYLETEKPTFVFKNDQHRFLHQAYLLRLPILRDDQKWYDPTGVKEEEKLVKIEKAFKNGIQLEMKKHTFALDLPSFYKHLELSFNYVRAVKGAYLLPSLIERKMAKLASWKKEIVRIKLVKYANEQLAKQLAHEGNGNEEEDPNCSLNPEFMALKEPGSPTFCSLRALKTDAKFDKIFMDTEMDMPKMEKSPKGELIGFDNGGSEERVNLKSLVDMIKNDIFVYCHEDMWKSESSTEEAELPSDAVANMPEANGQNNEDTNGLGSYVMSSRGDRIFVKSNANPEKNTWAEIVKNIRAKQQKNNGKMGKWLKKLN